MAVKNAVVPKEKDPTPLAPIEQRAIASGLVPVRPDYIDVLEDVDANEVTGLETVSSRERRIPILRILDPKSPACKPVERGGTPGAKAGDILNTSTGEVYDGKLGLHVIPAHRDWKFVKYIKRDDNGMGGGFVAVLEPEDPEVKERQDERMEEFGNLFGKLAAGTNADGKDLELVETYYLYCICIKPNADGGYAGEYGDFFPALIPFESTKIKEYNAFIERCKNMRYNVKGTDGILRPQEIAMWRHCWHLRTSFTERGQQNWYVWAMTRAAKKEDGSEDDYRMSRLNRDNPLVKGAEELRTLVLEGNAQVDFAKDAGDGQQPSNDRSHAPREGDDDYIPA